jgi:predicted metalloenzyme YecM
MEPPLPRRKKNPELAYRHHEFILDSSVDKTDSNVTRARVSFDHSTSIHVLFVVVIAISNIK